MHAAVRGDRGNERNRQDCEREDPVSPGREALQLPRGGYILTDGKPMGENR